MSWLPPRPRRARRAHCVPWLPPAVKRARLEAVEQGALAYVVVDDLDDAFATLAVASWPVVDSHGRVLFADEDDDRVLCVPIEPFAQLLRRRRAVPEERGDARARRALRGRRIRVGDVFAACLTGHAPFGDASTTAPLSRWFAGPILDITVEGRELARLQTSAATAGAVGDEFLYEVVAELQGDDEQGRGR
ncbi:MAG TPA: hypothetical protein VFS37_09220 [Conexibacter sp.]|nr:hypothetical protein [Conexibacter sp.]